MSKRQEEYTPGPWKVFGGEELWIFGGENLDFVVGSIQGRLDNIGGANAKLISAAPEMYDYGYKAALFLVNLLSCDELTYPFRGNAEVLIEQWREIEKKARGEA